MRVAAVITLGLVLPGCLFAEGDTCADKVCTAILISVGVSVVDSDGEEVPDMVTKTEYLPTGSVMREDSGEHLSGYYTILDDLFDKRLLLPGERHDVRFYARGDRGTAQGDFVIRAGDCVCHVELIAGPSELLLQPF